jgi:hypothetical protein
MSVARAMLAVRRFQLGAEDSGFKSVREMRQLPFLDTSALTRTYAVVPLQTLDQRSGGVLNCGQGKPGKPERSCVEPFRLLVWRRCRRLCANRSAGPFRLFTGRNRAGFWQRSCASSEIWISLKRLCTRLRRWYSGRTAPLADCNARFKAIDGMRRRARFDGVERDPGGRPASHLSDLQLGILG